MRGFQLANYLADAGGGILVLQYLREVEFDRAEEVHQGPGGAARLKENVVDFKPGRPHSNVVAEIGVRFGGRVAGQIGVDHRLSDAVAKTL